jgi:hypothetical protein
MTYSLVLFALSVTTSGLSEDFLSSTSTEKLTFRAPTKWEATAQEDAATKEWKAGDDATLAISVYPVAPVRPAKACLDQLVEALGKDEFTKTLVGTQPAAKKVVSDFVGEGEEAKTDANKITTSTYVGCNGQTKWVLTFSSKTKSAARFGPLLKRIIDSIRYKR